MSIPAFNGLLAAFVLFSLLAGLVGLMLDRAARAPGLATATVAMLIFGLSWGGLLLLGE
ncbi:hypothetical protein [Roseomonas marmotae]|uniref:Uncharacterized protein n=1 Tax=Roseomonas marmotae TaxID=2768161 RepID=A0ABS3KKZ3_9PROT|nr:hypothetical protein [Roseomonas marmotae]MBO1077001.1 hypothetical protein [Roseomonas marmotae]QTI79806.1 hypothetical protein IAI58_03120 [Roseomonas marmotae]